MKVNIESPVTPKQAASAVPRRTRPTAPLNLSWARPSYHADLMEQLR